MIEARKHQANMLFLLVNCGYFFIGGFTILIDERIKHEIKPIVFIGFLLTALLLAIITIYQIAMENKKQNPD